MSDSPFRRYQPPGEPDKYRKPVDPDGLSRKDRRDIEEHKWQMSTGAADELLDIDDDPFWSTEDDER